MLLRNINDPVLVKIGKKNRFDPCPYGMGR